MDRIWKFRIRADWGDKHWIYFELPWNYSESFSCELSEIKDKTTLGQFAETFDLNGIEVFEGDIVKKKNGDVRIVESLRYSWKLITFDDFTERFFKGAEERLDYYLADLSKLEVIGNIHDNPELARLAKIQQ